MGLTGLWPKDGPIPLETPPGPEFRRGHHCSPRIPHPNPGSGRYGPRPRLLPSPPPLDPLRGCCRCRLSHIPSPVRRRPPTPHLPPHLSSLVPCRRCSHRRRRPRRFPPIRLRRATPHAHAALQARIIPDASASASALTAGVLRGYNSASGPASGGEVALSDRLVEKFFSPEGERLVSAVAGSFGRDLVLAFYSLPADPSESSPVSWVDVVTRGSCRRAIRSWVEVFTATAVGVFIDKTIHINTYDQICAAATNPAYDTRLQELLVALCSASIETLVKTSHGVLSNASGNANGSSSSSGNGGIREGWTETVSSALAVPGNRKLALDLTGRATFEAGRSFLEFVLWRLHDGAKAGADATVRAGLCALRYMSERSMVITAICIVLCLYVLNGTWLLSPA
ncbi:hypothetical protein ACQ4PT_051352 [Festuca glaucescens]